MARPREFDEEEVLGAIKDVFWRKGYEGASYADLIEASGLHKGSLYAAFGDKRALYLRALRDYDEHEVAGAVALLTGEEGKKRSGAKRIEALLNAVIEAVTIDNDRRGCLLCNASVDQAPHDKDVEAMVSRGVARMQVAFGDALDGVKSDKARKETASLLTSVYFGMRVMAKSGASLTMLRQARNAALSMV
ncbi:MAG: TetR family transcriptional regulator [Hyphococcus sp.]|nr:MAG: TetR family transcriptional regulator [Marinicaulis sp.]